ncbi:MAG: hypothetical protein C0429_04430 [Sphingopyxis sp.]|jgi:hypothetical protein|nr:hypothetical protein [Sphingopyxis sp.]
MNGLRYVLGLIPFCLLITSANATPITYGCDTPADRFSAIEQSVNLQNFSINARIQPNEFRKGEYSPLAQIYIASVDEKNIWALKVVAPSHKAKSALVFLDMTVDGKTDEPFLIGNVDLGQQLPVSISVTDGAKISFKIGEMAGTPELALGGTANLKIICSTGDFVFSDLEWTSK